MPKKIAIITGPKVEQTGLVSFRFMFDSGAPRELYAELGVFGVLNLRERDRDEYPYWTVEKAPGPNKSVGMKMWEIFLFSRGRQVLTVSAEADHEGRGLKELIKETEDCVLLMQRDIFDDFAKACAELGVKVDFFHYSRTLSTS